MPKNKLKICKKHSSKENKIIVQYSALYCPFCKMNEELKSYKTEANYLWFKLGQKNSCTMGSCPDCI